MLYTTRGIVFKLTDYSESSVIIQVFTEKFGMQSYLINGVKKQKAKIRKNMLQPLHLLDMVVYNKHSPGLQRVAELKNDPVFRSIPYDIAKSSIVFFLNEVLYKSVKQQTADENLFAFVFHSIELLDSIEEGIAGFHLFFLLRLTQFLGFYPQRMHAETSDYFDLITGSYTKNLPAHAFVLQPPHTSYWTKLLQGNYQDIADIRIPADERKFILAKTLDYYRLHIDGFGEIQSHHILEEVLN